MSSPGWQKHDCWLCGAPGAHHPDGHGIACCRCFQEEFDHCANVRSLVIPPVIKGRLTGTEILQEILGDILPKVLEEKTPGNSRS